MSSFRVIEELWHSFVPGPLSIFKLALQFLLLTSSYIFLPSSYHLWCRWCLWHLCPHQLHGYPGLRLPAATARSGTIWYQYLYECNVALGQDTCDCTSCSSSCGPNVAGVQHYHGSFGRSVSEGYQRLRSQKSNSSRCAGLKGRALCIQFQPALVHVSMAVSCLETSECV